MSMEQQKKRDYEIYWPHVILVGAIALVLVLIGVVISEKTRNISRFL